jgi:AcrR family transcriptional regulator
MQRTDSPETSDPPDREPIPEPPWWSSPRDAAERSRTPLTRDAIVEAALAVLGREGLDALSMRQVAAELGVGAASLYWHVSGKEHLLTLVLDRVIGEIPRPEPDPARWQEQIRQFARDTRTAFQRYRGVARASMGRVPVGPNFLLVVEWQLSLFEQAGLPKRPAAWFGDLLALYVAAHALEDDVRAGETDDPGEIAAMLESYFATLPPERFPALTASAPNLMAGSPDDRFEFGLELILRGLEAMAERERAT